MEKIALCISVHYGNTDKNNGPCSMFNEYSCICYVQSYIKYSVSYSCALQTHLRVSELLSNKEVKM
jgi:hypothetical protein